MHVSRAREDNQQCIMLTLHFPAHCQCISTLHCRIQDNKLRSLVPPYDLCSLLRISTMDFMPKSFQPPCDHLYQITITIHHQKFHHNPSSKTCPNMDMPYSVFSSCFTQNRVGTHVLRLVHRRNFLSN